MKLTALILFPALCLAGDLQPVELPAPRTAGGMPLMAALNKRQSSREFDGAKLPPQVLSNLLWAAAGVNRPDGKLTYPSAHDRREIAVYVATSDGLYVYEAEGHRLKPVAGGDQRPATGTQAFVRDASVNLVYVADLSKMADGPEETKTQYAAMAAGAIAQNVYLYCASEGLATVVRVSIDKAAFGRAANLRPAQRVMVAQSVGYGKK